MGLNTSLKAMRYVLQKDRDAKQNLQNLAVRLKLDFSFVDINKRWLWGNEIYSEFSEKFLFEEIDLGTFYASSKDGKLLLETLKIFFRKEWEKKNIGREVLGLYREINMIYGLSEMLSETIDSATIAQIALQEASQIIGITHGLFLMYDAENDEVLEISSFGENPNRGANLETQQNLIKELINRGTAAIVPSERIPKNPAIKHLKAVMYAPLKVKHRNLGIMILGHEDLIEFTAAELKLLTTIALQSAAAIESAHLYEKGLKEAKEREEAIRKIHDVSQKFVPSKFITSLGKDKLTEVALGDLVEREVTVVFVDIRDFTTISETLNPTDNFLFVNGFNGRMGPYIRKNQGFIMQYLGDGFMALFPGGSQDALRASVEMQEALQKYNKERLGKNRMPVKVGIGMQSGNLIMGITGDVERLDAAIIADTVNTAARIEGLSKHFGNSILLTGVCKDNLTHPEEFEFRYLGLVKVKGKQKPIKLYECINGDLPKLYKHKLATKKTFEEGMDLYFNQDFAMAAVTFQRIFKRNADDHTAKLFLNRSAHLITKELGDDWKGIELMSTK
ncbi:adenylate/guanylate cyclase domain-containing protein [Eudoraea sp.]|uniref:adenylate/guanylate cyclase domain-containing protein n=2 Tax=Eudoraea sp. TaxID=1979955 RepID=UPI003C773B52